MGSHALQMMGAIVFSLGLFLVVYLLDEKKIFFFLAFMIPFQIIDSKYGSLNFVMTAVFFVALVRKYQSRSIPLKGPGRIVTVAFIGFLVAELLSLTQAPSSTWDLNLYYVVNIAGNYLLLFLAANLIKDESQVVKLIYWLAAGNIVVVIYCAAQGLLGFEGYAFMGVQELSMKTIREDKRILGPFMNTQAFVGYMVLQSMFLLYARFVLAKTVVQKWFWSLLLLCTMGALVASNTRTGFLSFILGMLLTTLFLVRHVGIGRSLYLLVGGTAALAAASYAVVTYTEYNRLFERLSNTEVTNLEVDTRKGLIPLFLREIAKKPLIGHRPMFGLPKKIRQSRNKLSYPHNLYIYLLYTVGMLGFTFFMLFLGSVFLRLRQAGKNWSGFQRLKAFPAFCMMVFLVFLVQQYFISFIRFETRDFQQYIFLLFGLFCALPHLAGQLSDELCHARDCGLNPGNGCGSVADNTPAGTPT